LKVSIKDQNHKISEYWSASELIKGGSKLSFDSDADATENLERILQKSVKRQMIADVPLGAFLSGGIDSSTIVALMQSQSMKKIRTFTIGFDDKAFNEADHAKLIASHLNTDHSELYINSNDLLNVIPNLSSIYDEPFADSSQIPTYLISQFAKQDVTVALSGDGGDELFGGYNRYQITNQYWNRLRHIPLSIRKLLSSAILAVLQSQTIDLHSRLNKNAHYSNFADKLYKGANVLPSKDIYSLYKGLTSAYIEPDSIVIDGNESNEFFESNYQNFKGLDNLSMMMAMDLLTYMPDDILTKVDRAAMGVSLETRVPMLDHKVVEFALSLSNKYKLRNNQTKWLLKQTLYKYVPQNLIERPKSGFAIPIGIWLRTSLKDWADDLLNERTINDQGFLNAGLIRKRWHQHQSGSHNWEHFLWNVLMFQSWFINFHEKN
jgi:asparagine synthase (glutamine-hydrolysing)